MADRGFARASLFEMLLHEGIDCVVRFDNNTTLWVNGKACRTGDIALGRKSLRWLGSVRYHAKRKVPLQVLVCESEGSRWNLATSLDRAGKPRQVYFSRMQIEEMFRDLKQHLHIQKMPYATLARKATWLLLCALAYTYLYWVGVLAKAAGLSERYHYWKTESVFWLGLQLVRHHDPWLATLTRGLLKPAPIPYHFSG
ncbi:MAG: transposase [Armatimonadetes bacterium]|nr:transposase [Armatimonadota bacterium]